MNKTALFGLISLLTASPASAQQSGDYLRRFQRIDRNGDGKVTREEAGNAEWFRRILQRRDANRDGALALDEVRSGSRMSRVDDANNVTDLPMIDIAYGSDKAQRLDVFVPAEETKNAPVMVYVHGGGWRAGDKSRVASKPTFFRGEGWVLVSVNYRLIPEGKHPKNAEDVAAAIAWVHDHISEFGGDPDSIFIMGHSAGCHLVSLVATDGRHLQKMGKSLSHLKGVIALDTQAYDVPKIAQGDRSDVYVSVFGDEEAIQRDASPIHHVAEGKGTPPFLICYSRGMSQRLNPNRVDAAKAFAAALHEAGVSVEIVDATDRSHGEINAWFGDSTDKQVTGAASRFLTGVLEGRGVESKNPTTH